MKPKDKTMKRTSVSAIALVIASLSSANASDLFSPGGLKDVVSNTGANTWTGFFLGANVGYGWDAGKTVDSASTSYGTTTVVSADVVPAGGMAGLEAGYNIPLMAGLIGGVWTDVHITNINDNSSVVQQVGTSVPTAIGSANSTIDWVGTTQVMLGLPAGQLLFFATGGAAYGGVSDRATSGAVTLSNDDVRFGWAAGGGVGLSLSQAWKVKVQYQHIDLGQDTLSGVLNQGAGATAVKSTNNEIDSVMLSIDYHL